MTVSEAEQQCVVGAAKGKPPCVHPESDTEVSPDGEFTGFQVCSSGEEYVGEEIENFFDDGESC